MAISLLGYAGFPRFNKMASMGECDVKFYNEHLEKLNFVKPRKADLFRDGAWVCIAQTHTFVQ